MIDVSAMTDASNINYPYRIMNGVDHTVVADTDPPKILFALQLLATDRSRFLAQVVDRRRDPNVHRTRKFPQGFHRGL